jgi:DNA-binding CsgD family transcriptional regulator
VTLEITEEAYLAHYGVLRRSGRYPWGSGGPETASNKGFLDYVDLLKKQGLTETQIAEGMGMNSTQLRAAKSIAKNEEKAAVISQVQRMAEKGMSTSAIARQLDMNESSVRALRAPGAADKAKVLNSTAEMLKNQVDAKGVIDIGTGVEQHVGISRTRLDTAIAVLKEQGYVTHTVQVDQLGSAGNKTNIKVLAKPETTYRDIAKDIEVIKPIDLVSSDGGRSYGEKIGPPVSVDPKRVGIRYSEVDSKGDLKGGVDADGIIYLRPGVKDLDLGGASYAQVRITVGDKHYLKGMAMYKDDLPAGTDLLFNTNKTDKGDPLKAMKEMKTDKDGNVDFDNPFGATISRQKGVLNIVNEEGDWDKWSRNFSSQMLSKQSPTLAKQQLDLTLENKRADLDEIRQLTNPEVRRNLLMKYGDSADSAAVHLKAASLPRSASHVILPFNSLKEGEIYAPNYENGERVSLVRYPHGGKFEIPELTVNNNHPAAKKTIGRAKDAVGINHKVAERLSGADFDGDTVLVIPNNKGQVKSEPALQGLKKFDPQREYPAYDGMRTMSGGTYNAKTGKVDYAPGKGPSGKVKQTEMGKVSNLITDMTIMGATSDELARAVRHSMVVIDAEKHNLNFKESAVVNGISALQQKYQGQGGGGAATLISRATSPTKVLARKRTPIIDKETGKKVWVETGENWVDAKTGKTVYKKQESQKLKETDDARTLISDANTKIENVYASHSNNLKALANTARKEAVNTKTTPYSESARKAYAPEVASLSAKLNLALRNRPLERQAQLLANASVRKKLDASVDLDSAEIKKLKGNELRRARERVGAGKEQIHIEDAEWAAIQAGAVSATRLRDILDNADLDRVRELAMPRTERGMTPTKEARARSMINLGYSQADIAAALGVSSSTIKDLM